MQSGISRWVVKGAVAWLALLLSSFVYADTAQGLVAYYPFNANALDESGNGNHGLAVGAALTEDRFGRADKAYSFDGADDTIWIINSPSLNVQTAVTISAWIYLDSYPAQWISIVNKWSSYVLQMHPQYGLTLTIFDKDFKGVWRNMPTDQDFALGRWYHVAASFDEVSGMAQLYIDGAPVSSQPRLGSGYPTSINGGSDDVKLGSERNNQWWHGALDDVRIYDRALLDEEIMRLYNETPTVPQTIVNLAVDGLQVDTASGEIRLNAKIDPSDPAFQALVANPQVRLSMEFQTESGDAATVRFGVAAQGQVTTETVQSGLSYGAFPEVTAAEAEDASERCDLDNGKHLGFFKKRRHLDGLLDHGHGHFPAVNGDKHGAVRR